MKDEIHSSKLRYTIHRRICKKQIASINKIKMLMEAICKKQIASINILILFCFRFGIFTFNNCKEILTRKIYLRNELQTHLLL